MSNGTTRRNHHLLRKQTTGVIELRHSYATSSMNRTLRDTVTTKSDTCGPDATCTYTYTSGTELQLFANAPASLGSNARFDKWDSDCKDLGSEQYPNLIIDRDLECVAKFTDR